MTWTLAVEIAIAVPLAIAWAFIFVEEWRGEGILRFGDDER